MKLNNIWGYGQLFGFSGLDGVTGFCDDFIGTLTRRKIEIRFELHEWVKLYFPVCGRVKFNAITGDMIDGETKDGKVLIVFADCDTVIGYAPVLPKVITQKKWNFLQTPQGDVWYSDTDAIALFTKQRADGSYQFVFAHSEACYTIALGLIYRWMSVDVEEIKRARYEYFKTMPKCKNKKYERLYYKALSINKVNVRSAEGGIPCLWTTPDRVPHKRLWLWDSAFHALAFATYNGEMAKNALRAVLAQQRADGFIPCMMNPYGQSLDTQPQVLAWGVWEVYKKTGDKAFLQECVGALDGYLTWDKNNRDTNGNGLLEWYSNPADTDCKCGESGQDNSPRFEFGENMDAVDFSVFQSHDAEYLAKIYEELGDFESAEKWRNYSVKMCELINEYLWDEESGIYYDRLLSGKPTKVLTPSCFFPMFVGAPSKEQVEKMVKVLTDKELLWTELPIPSVAKNNELYSTDMWRGGVWLNINYFVARGLKKYGYNELADELIAKILDAVNKWYKKTGSIYEFYDPENKIPPYQCERKGKPITPPDWRKHVHSISDYNWSACFTLLFIQNELYLD